MKKPIEILCAGELLLDLESDVIADQMDTSRFFKRIPGGSAANVAIQMACLGNNAILVAAVGQDDMGSLLIQYANEQGVHASCITQVPEPTTLMLWTRTHAGVNLQPYRGADAALSLRQFPHSKFNELSIFHTTCFAVSRVPAQNVILEAAEKAVRSGSKTSIDINFDLRYWPEQKEAQRVVSDYCHLKAMVKISEGQYEQLYGESPGHNAILDRFLKLGASEMCLTLASGGCWVADESQRHFVAGEKIDQFREKGLGDAFWAGYLTARLNALDIQSSAAAGLKLAALRNLPGASAVTKIEKSAIL